MSTIKTTGIYAVVSAENISYIGCSRNIEDRLNCHRIGRSSNTGLKESIKKIGVHRHQFKILHQLPSDVCQEVLFSYEQFYISQYNSCGLALFNETEGGLSVSEKARKAQVAAVKGSSNTEEQKKRKSEARILALQGEKGDDIRRRTSETMKGKPKTEEHNRKAAQARVGQKRTEESKRKMREARLRYISENGNYLPKKK